jgi:hypothetical protein
MPLIEPLSSMIQFERAVVRFVSRARAGASAERHRDHPTELTAVNPASTAAA